MSEKEAIERLRFDMMDGEKRIMVDFLDLRDLLAANAEKKRLLREIEWSDYEPDMNVGAVFGNPKMCLFCRATGVWEDSRKHKSDCPLQLALEGTNE